MKRRLLSMLMVLCMIASLFSTAAFADGDNVPDARPDAAADNEPAEALEAFSEPEEPAIPVHEHAYVPIVTEPTCTTQGFTTYTCACGDSYIADYTDALNHPQTIEVPEIPATESTAGTTGGIQCAVCGAILSGCGEIPMLQPAVEDIPEKPAPVALDTETASIAAVNGTTGTDFSIEWTSDDDVHVIPGGQTEFGIRATSQDGVVYYQWYEFDFESPDGNPEILLEGETGNTYQTPAILYERCFFCEVTDNFGHFETLYFEVTPDSGLAVEAVGEKNIVVKQGKPVTLQIVGTANYGAVHYEWCYVSGNNILPIEGENSDTFQIASVASDLYSAGNDQYIIGRVHDDYRNIADVDFHVIVVEDDDVVSSGSCGDGVTWTLDNELTLTISGTGMINYDTADSAAVWSAYKAYIKKVVIMEGVTGMCEYAFDHYESLQSVTIPSTVQTIGMSAFSVCPNLTDVSIAEGVTGLDIGAFSYCNNLTALDFLPNSLTSIGKGAFSWCENLSTAVIPAGVTSIGDEAFACCFALSDVTLLGDMPSIGNSVFYEVTATVTYPGSNNTYTSSNMLDYGGTLTWESDGSSQPGISGTCGENLTWVLNEEGVLTISGTGSIANYTMTNPAPWNDYAAQIETVVIETGATSIGERAFAGCSNLTDFTIPDSLNSIGKYAFQNCKKITDITIPAGLTIGERAFSGCSLKSIIVLGDVSIGADAFRGNTITSAGPIGSGCEYEFAWTTSIPANAFQGFGKLTSITIPDSVTEIGGGALHGCSSLTDISLPASLKTIGGEAFRNCIGLTDVTIPDGMTTIGANAFQNCRNLEKIRIPESVTSLFYQIGSMAGCSKLITAGPIGSGCNIEFGWTTAIPENAFSGANCLTSIILPDGLTSIGHEAFSNCSSLTSVIIPESVTSSGSQVFMGCSKLITAGPIGSGCNIEFGWTDLIPDHAFASGSNLESITIPDSVTAIGIAAFAQCSSLTDIILPDGLASIGNEAFYGCSGLTGITIPDNVTAMGDAAFTRCSSLTAVKLPAGITSIGESAFAYCSSLSDITIPDNVTNIGDMAFSRCSSLKAITLPSGITSIGKYAFNSLSSLTLQGDMPGISDYGIFSGEVTVYYPCSGNGYTNESMHNYGGIVTWTLYHKWGEPEWTWEGTESATAAFTCQYDNSHVMTVTASGEDITKTNTENEEVYTATVIFDGESYTDTKTISTVQLTLEDLTLAAGESKAITVTGADSSAVSWSSSNPEVAEVSETGTVTGRKVGTAIITGTFGSTAARCEVTVLFSDVKDASAYFYGPVYWAVENGVTSGTSPSTFSPSNPCTRGQIVTFLWKAMGSPEPGTANNPFTDVSTSDYFYKPVLWAKENGITSGKTATTFEPYSTCTRGQIVTFLWKAMGSPEPSSMNNPFTDVTETDYFFKPVLWAKESGITSGTSATTFSPFNPCTRAQAMTFLYKAVH